MNHVYPAVQIEALLAVERVLVSQPHDVRGRVLRRARASVPRRLHAHRAVVSPGRSRRWAIGKVAAAALVLTTLCSAAFYAGYRAKSSIEPAPAPARAAKEGATVQSLGREYAATPVPSVSVAPSCALPAASVAPEPAPRAPLWAKAKPGSESEIYAMELRALQPAQQAVARQEYSSALAAIANHRRQFPAGRLAEEREALRVKALLALGRSSEAERAGAAFRSRFPQSALRERMDEMLEAQP